jgi:AcrR family transcriptional regulator
VYSILDVRTNQSVPLDDLTARARIRDAAIASFAATGFDATVRQIAARAGVSAGLITHHFGSKEALRAECDDEVLRRILELKVDTLHLPPSQAIGRIAGLDDYGPMFGYTLRCVREGGEAGRVFLQNMIEDAREYTADAVERGMVLPSADPEARVEMLVTQSIGGFLLQLTLRGENDFSDGAHLIRVLTGSTTFALLELYTQGLLTDSSLLNEYLKLMPQAAPAADKQATTQ